DLYAALGSGKVAVSQVLAKLVGRDEFEMRKARVKSRATNGAAPHRGGPAQGILVRGMDDMLVRISRCCNPVPGDRIVGYITRGRGVSVHRHDCPNIAALGDEIERRIEVEWRSGETGAFAVEIEVEAI